MAAEKSFCAAGIFTVGDRPEVKGVAEDIVRLISERMDHPHVDIAAHFAHLASLVGQNMGAFDGAHIDVHAINVSAACVCPTTVFAMVLWQAICYSNVPDPQANLWAAAHTVVQNLLQ